MDKFVPFLKGLRNEHCELDMWANSKNRLFIRWVGEKTKDKHWWHKLNINGSPANHEMASFARESLNEFVEEIEQFIGKSDLADVIQVKPNWRFWEGDCKDKSCNIGGKVGSINFLSELEPEQVKNFYDNMDTYAMLESRKVNEARKQIMWAINFRNMHTAVHGMFYGKSKKRVEEFANEIEYIEKNDDLDWDEKLYAWERMYEEYPDIATMDEFNYRDIVDLPGGYEGIEDGDTIYRFVNRGTMDIYNESKRKGKMKKIVKESKVDKNALKEAIYDYGRACEKYGKACVGEQYSRQDERDAEFNMNKRRRELYRLVGLSGYDESSKKIVKETTADNDGVPRIYVGTYAKYNDGSIDGKWIDIPDYNTYEEFVDACRELHSDENDPEFMVQDYENFPRKWYHEGGLPSEEEFDKINEFYMMDDDEKAAYEEYVDLDYGDDDIEAFHEKYIGKFHSMSDFGYYLIDNYGMPSENIDWYFDYEAFGRELTMDWHQGDPDEMDDEGEPENPEYYYDSDGHMEMPYDSDKEVAEQWVDDMGGIEQLSKETIERYFDYEEFGRIVFDNDCSESNGYVFWSH